MLALLNAALYILRGAGFAADVKALGLPDLKAILKGEKTIRINPIDTAERMPAFPVVLEHSMVGVSCAARCQRKNEIKSSRRRIAG